MDKTFFLDTNVILDLVQHRGDHSLLAKGIFKLQEAGEIDLFASALSVATTAYFVKKEKLETGPIIADLLELVTVIDLTAEILHLATVSKFNDFEDALQYHSALKVKGLDAIITRNPKDFRHSRITVLTPKEFLQSRMNSL